MGVLWIGALTLSGCATTTNPSFEQQDTSWAEPILSYEANLAEGHPDRPDQMLQVADELRKIVRKKFTRGDRHRRARALAEWLIAKDGHGMVYDLEANFKPERAFAERRGNCLSFTLLLVTLANEIGIDLKYNDVDLPGMWAMDEQAGLVFYRHINAIFKSPNHTQVFDLAMQDYDAGFPQRTIPPRAAAALLHSNLGIEELKSQNMAQAFHHLKLAVSIDPKNSDLWINLGAAYKRNVQFELAEKALKTALNLNDKNSLAASNLERLFRSQGRRKESEYFRKLAARARLKNPYVQFRNAQRQFQASKLQQAQKSIRRAIRLHDQDPKFFELSSRINQRFKRYKPALIDLEKAFKLTNDVDERERYYNKVKWVAKRAEQEALAQKKRRRGSYERQPQLVEFPPVTF